MESPLVRRVHAFSCSRLTVHAALLLGVFFLLCPLARAQSAELDPRVEELYGEAKSAEASGDAATAAAKYESIIEIDPKLAAAYNNLGALYFRQREFEKAVGILERGLRI